MHPSSLRRRFPVTFARVFAQAVLAIALIASPIASAHADGQAAEADVPKKLSLDKALEIFHARGYDLLVAEAAVLSAEGDESIAGAVPNPSFTGSVGSLLNYDPKACPDNTCSRYSFGVGVSDNGAVFDSLSGKRGLRLKVARKALAAAKMNKVDAQRVLDLQVKQQYLLLAYTQAALKFSKEVQVSAEKNLDFNKARSPGKIDEGMLARIETQKLESDRAVENAQLAVKQARVSLAFLLGVRTTVPELEAEGDPLKYAEPKPLTTASEDSLLKEAFTHRPDLLATGFLKERAEAAIASAKRLRFPEVALFAQYNQTGSGQSAVQPPTITIGLTITLPTFYQYQGEIKKASADLTVQSVTEKKLQGQILSDVTNAYDTYLTNKKLVELMEKSLLDRAKKARDITEAQFAEGKALLTDYLDAQRTFIATNVEYLQDLQNYWTAVFQLEQAVGMDLRK